MDLAAWLPRLGQVVGGPHGEPGVGAAAEGHVDSYCQVGGDWCSAVADVCKNLFVNMQMFGCLGDCEIEFSNAVPEQRPSWMGGFFTGTVTRLSRLV